ncbi:MmgE/PrpD family protein [Amycolatopsis sp. CA-161197]|uniref:MmgE/PrpD family protein n=1 Tax=Amycolatopsis sp. CA-161197 TaxID=3239922 RepID=UPI003D89C81E
MTEEILALVHAPVADSPEAAIALTLVRAAEPADVVREALGLAADRSTGRARLFGTAAAKLHLEWAAVVAAVAALDGAPDAVVAGYAVARAVADGLGPDHTRSGWCLETTAGTVAAAAAAARVLDLRGPALRHTIGIAATQASGLAALTGTPLGAAQLGHAAATGVEAALLARNGVTAADDPLSGRRGLFALMRSTGES